MFVHKMLQRTVFSHTVLIVLCMTYVSCFQQNFLDKNFIWRLKREALSDPESTTHHPDTNPTPSDYQETPTDTIPQDPDYLSHLHGDTGHSSAPEGQGHIDMAPHVGSHGDTGAHSDSGSNPDFYSGGPDYPTSDPGLAHDNVRHSDHYAPDMRADYYNPLDMTRPGEAPPRYLSNVQPEKRENMPRALPLTQEPTPSDTVSDGTQLDQGQGEVTGDPGADPYNPDSSQDIPIALPQTQEFVPDSGREPIALPQKQGTTKTRTPSPDPTLDRPFPGQRSRSRPRPRPREPLKQQPNQRAQDPGTDLLAAAAILNPDVHDTVHDTVADGMEMIAKQQAMDHLDRQLSGAPRERARGRGVSDTRGRPGPNWGGSEQPSAPRRSNSRGSPADPLDTIARVRNMKAQADLVQDHVDTAHDIHQDRTDYMYGSRDPYDRQYGRPYDSRYDSSYDRYYRRNHNSGERFPSNQNFESSRRYGQYDPYPSYPPHYRGGGDRHDGHYYHREEDGYHGYNGYQPGIKLDINTGLPCSNMSDPGCRAQGYREIQIETPHGELDMEPGEMDLEGAAAADLLRMLGFAQNPALPPGHQEININHNVLAALQSRFGINNTAAIRRMSSDREFQKFMYQVLTHSGRNAHGEYNANLTKTEVDRLLANLDTSRSRLSTANLDHAKLNIAPPTDGANDTSQSEAVLTLDGGPAQNNMNMGLPMLGNLGNLGNVPGFASPLVQNGGQGPTEKVAQPGSVAALVQSMLGGGGEAGEGTGGGEAGEGITEGQGTNKTQAHTGGEGHQGAQGTNGTHIGKEVEATEASESKQKVHNLTQNEPNNTATVPEKSPQTQKVQDIPHTENARNISQIPNAETNLPVNAQQTSYNTSSAHKETDILGKDGNAKLSKDTMTKAKETTSGATTDVGSTINETGVVAGTAVGSSTGSGGGTGVVAGTAAGSSTGSGGGTGVKAGTVAGSSTGSGDGTGVPGQGASNTATGAGQDGTGTGQSGTGGTTGAEANNQPIGLAEAGIDPGAQAAEPKNQIPTEAIEKGYKASTAFAIASITLLALAIIVCPILCLLCKWREKFEQRKRKEKAMKNRDVSDNNIWDAMMLHEFGPEAPNFVANEAEAAANYYKTDYKSEKPYYDIAEIEALKPGRHSQTGHLP